VEDFIPSQSAETIRRQEMAALSLCSSRQFVPDRYRAFLEDRDGGVGAGS
jgi:hypothetical protein